MCFLTTIIRIENLFLVDSSNILNGFLDEQGDGDYFDRTEKNQLFLWGVHSETKSKARLNIDSLNNTI